MHLFVKSSKNNFFKKLIAEECQEIEGARQAKSWGSSCQKRIEDEETQSLK